MHMTFGEKVREARKARELSQKELAKRSGIAVRTIINYETNARTPKSRETYVNLAKALDIDPAVLMDDNAEFVIRASEMYGNRARRQAERIISEVEGLYAGGELDERDMDAMMKALQEAYWKAKEINRKYVPKKYRKEEEE